MDPIDRQAAIEAIMEDKIEGNALSIMVAIGEGKQAETLNETCDRHAQLLKDLPSAKPEQSDASEFWRKRADYYSDMCLKLINEMGKGVKIGSVKISENGLEFIKEKPSAQANTSNALETLDCISRQAAIEVIDAVLPVDPMKSEYAQGIACGAALAKTYVEQLPSVQSDVPDTNVGDINKFIDSLEEIFADLRERHGDDSVCGLCEYDGAYIGQSGDWCNECPGFDRDDCFKLSDECRRRWIDTITKSLPSAQPEIIRCKDCKWWDKYGENHGYCMRVRRWGGYFCADAERREE